MLIIGRRELSVYVVAPIDVLNIGVKFQSAFGRHLLPTCPTSGFLEPRGGTIDYKFITLNQIHMKLIAIL